MMVPVEVTIVIEIGDDEPLSGETHEQVAQDIVHDAIPYVEVKDAKVIST